jgi:predicted nuclease of restriction endonuclease-like (RecB) superfamily
VPNIEQKNNISNLYKNIKTIIDSSKERATIALNNTMILSYWEIGERLKKEILKDKRATYGQEVVKKVSEKLTLEYGRGYSKASLLRMVQVYTIFSDKQIVVTLSRQLSWSHFIEFIKIKDNELKREFYIAMSIHERWNVRTLRERINSMLLVLIELKIGEFDPQYKGQVELYLKWLSKYEKQEDEQEPIAIILCASKDSEVVELMDLERDNIHISEYWLQLPPRELLEQKLYRAIEHVKSLDILEEQNSNRN